MKKLFTVLLFNAFLFPALGFCQQGSSDQQGDRMQWWREARFGMFIHWGLYAVPAGEWEGKTDYGEWIRNSAEIPIDTYDQFRGQFNPVKFNADEWVKMAKDAGVKYIVITSKHHDGFCMFDTKQTDFNIMNTPFHHDPMKDLADACHKYGVKFCFYYSIMDWHHPDYLPRRSWEKARPINGADFRKYVQYMKAELKELLTNYGEISVLWFDGEWESTWNEKLGKEIYTWCRSLQPNIIINNRVGAGRLDMEGLTREGAFGGDFGTPEQQIPATGLPGTDWETCMTMNDHWGYNKNDKDFKPAKEMIRMLTDIASKGGNYLLNVGPTSLGQIPPESIDRLKSIGNWMRVNGESIYGTQASPFHSLAWGRCTRKEIPGGVRLYLHVFNWPETHSLVIPGVLNEPLKAYLLADVNKNSLKVNRSEDALLITLPTEMPDTINTVVVLDLKGRLDLTEPPQILSDFDSFVDKLDVILKTDRENVQIHYTTDNTDPGINSPVYNGTLIIRDPMIISARCFRDGKPVSGTSKRLFSQSVPLRGISVLKPLPGIAYNYYEGNWDSIPDFKQLKVIKTGSLDNFSLDPKIAKEYYGFSFRGYIMVPSTDIYAFFTNSDDGSALWIDGKKVVDNDGLHGMKEAGSEVGLAKGYHEIRVDYFNKTGSDGLTLSIHSPAIKKQAVPASMLVH
ncbi:MAG: alpha-L-fucosidase [Bacteroidales bacterium]|jgi:alpha-L-fucosidase